MTVRRMSGLCERRQRPTQLIYLTEPCDYRWKDMKGDHHICM